MEAWNHSDGLLSNRWIDDAGDEQKVCGELGNVDEAVLAGDHFFRPITSLLTLLQTKEQAFDGGWIPSLVHHGIDINRFA
jgi:hypothetical protein